MKQASIANSIYTLVACIPEGKVMTYGSIALSLGLNTPRIVGYYLHRNPDQSSIPCHRVVSSQGRLAPAFAFGGHQKQRELLEKEGVTFTNECVNLSKHRWIPHLGD